MRGCHTTLRSALAKAVDEKLIIRNPADGCRLPSAKPREMQVLTPEEMQRLLIQAKEDGCYPPYIKRLMDNISSNLIKYADPVVPLLIETIRSDDGIGIAFQNAIKMQAVKPESTHISLSNMRTMMEKMDGKCLVFQTTSTFRVELLFPVQ